MQVDARRLRVWHWRKVLYNRKRAQHYAEIAKEWELLHRKRCSWSRNRENSHNRIADFHLSAVQVMNDHPNCIGTTAEEDEPLYPRQAQHHALG